MALLEIRSSRFPKGPEDLNEYQIAGDVQRTVCLIFLKPSATFCIFVSLLVSFFFFKYKMLSVHMPGIFHTEFCIGRCSMATPMDVLTRAVSSVF